MDIYTLYGKSGTGKSFRAQSLCQELNIESIIDDGLFILKGQIVAGKSAKKEATTIGAIKTAIFFEDEHCLRVCHAIRKSDPSSILVIGTSKKMVDRIINRLGLPEPVEDIAIESISTPQDRLIAAKQRKRFGKHVIPVPSVQLKKDFAGYFMDPVKILRDLSASASASRVGTALISSGVVSGSSMYTENTRDISVVRPTFSYLGEFTISDRVIEDIVRGTSKKAGNKLKIISVYENALYENLEIDIHALATDECNPFHEVKRLQEYVSLMVEKMTAFNVYRINVYLKGIYDVNSRR